MAEGGYHYRFVKEDQIMDMFVCKLCQDVSRDPYETKCCNNTFCKSCIDKLCAKWKKSCPMCRSYLETAEAVQIRRSIKQLDVYCEYEKNGCKWIGQVEAIDKHLQKCHYKPMPCEYHIVGCKTKVAYSRQTEHNQKDMKRHFKLVLDCVKKLNDTREQLKDYENKRTRQKDIDAFNFTITLRNAERDADLRLANTQRQLDMAKRSNNHYVEMIRWLIVFLAVSWLILIVVALYYIITNI